MGIFKILGIFALVISLLLGIIIYDANSFRDELENNNQIIAFYDNDNIYFAVEMEEFSNIEDAIVYDKEKIDGIKDSKDKVIFLIDDKIIDDSKVNAGIVKFEKDSLIRYLKTSEIDTPLRDYITLYSGDFKVLAFGLLIQDISSKETPVLLDYYNKDLIKISPDHFSLKVFRILPENLQLKIIEMIFK
ncbi:hypothetical protein J4476_03200 [Candidatus Woesearchaeota archaeon]|nr:MAG: hypothetical protein QT09_C0004G0016 [archaeon GW2011_AR18]MBS3161675.1 hypothetical protein [Candidatus Woesearchaeota archaeon]HIH26003.1 hypothetical protein [Nanoarchaeota archaeon]